jgi:hypothetical protein
LADKGGAAQISTAMRVLAEIIASDVSLLVTFNQAIDGVIQNNPKARANPKALAQLDGYKRPLVSSLSANLQRFGMERVGNDFLQVLDGHKQRGRCAWSPSGRARSESDRGTINPVYLNIQDSNAYVLCSKKSSASYALFAALT